MRRLKQGRKEKSVDVNRRLKQVRTRVYTPHQLVAVVSQVVACQPPRKPQKKKKTKKEKEKYIGRDVTVHHKDVAIEVSCQRLFSVYKMYQLNRLIYT